MQHARSVDTDEEEGDGTSEVDQDGPSHCGTVDTHTLVGREIAETAGTVVYLFQIGKIEGRTVRPVCVFVCVCVCVHVQGGGGYNTCTHSDNPQTYQSESHQSEITTLA